MDLRTQLLIALCHVCFIGAKEPEMPQAVMDVLSRAEIHSISDLPFLLPFDSVEYYSSESILRPRSVSHTRSRDSPEEAQIAACKPRNASVEIPRALLDTSSANFMLWPGCVELPRCSGCCNTAARRCTPSRIHTRQLKVAKIEYTRKRLRMKEVLVKMEEHLECRCECVPETACGDLEVYDRDACKCVPARRKKRRRQLCQDHMGPKGECVAPRQVPSQPWHAAHRSDTTAEHCCGQSRKKQSHRTPLGQSRSTLLRTKPEKAKPQNITWTEPEKAEPQNITWAKPQNITWEKPENFTWTKAQNATCQEEMRPVATGVATATETPTPLPASCPR
ncbi:unnamed protein product [Lampetra fluviatilis]